MTGRAFVATVLTACGITGILSGSEGSPTAGGQHAVKTKVLHFPKDRCIGQVYAESDPDPARPDPERVDLFKLDPFTFCTTSEFVAAAQGDVVVPADRPITLVISLALRQEDRSRVHEWYGPLVEKLSANGPEDLHALSGLGPNDLCRLSVHSLARMARVEDCVLKPISRLTGLQILTLSGTGMTDTGMAFFRSLRSLRALELLYESRINGPGLAVLQDLPALEHLQCGTGMTDAGLKYLGQLPHLRSLKLRTGGIGGPGLSDLAALPCLERLCLVGGGDQHVQHLRGLTRLKGLTLWGPDQPLTDASLAAIGRLSALEEFYVIGWGARTDFTDLGVAYLKDLKHLKKVDFGSSARIGAAGIRHLTGLPDIESLAGIKPTDDVVKMLPCFPNLRRLSIQNRFAAPVSLGPLTSLRCLEELMLYDPYVSDDDLKCLESLSHLKRLHLSGGPDANGVITNGIQSICKLRQLESLELDTCVTRSGLNQLSCLASLQNLSLRLRQADADGITLDLSRLRNLRRLVLGPLAGEADLACLSALPHLQVLFISGEIPEWAMGHLKGLSELTWLQIYGISCSTGDGLTYLGGLKKLETLRLSGQVTDAAVYHLAGLSPSVAGINVHTPDPIQAKTIAHVKESLPRLHDLGVEKLEPAGAGRPRTSNNRP